MLLTKILWYIAATLILSSGLYFTYKLRGIQFSFKSMIRAVFKSSNDDKISSFETLTLSLSSRIGVGSISGVALAIYLGGPGTIFWMNLSALIGASCAYAESFLAIKYQKKIKDSFIGGPMHYLNKGLNKKRLAKIYALIILIIHPIGFMGIQSNTISKALTSLINISPYLIGIIMGICTFLTIFGNTKKIIKATSTIVPFMSVLYIIVILFVIISNFNLLPKIIIDIFISAFSLKSFSVGALMSTIIIGVQRGIFSNEAGIGTGAIASGAAESSTAKEQGLTQSFSIYIDTILICTITAIVILMANLNFSAYSDVNGIEITLSAFNVFLGKFGNLFVTVSIILFAFATIIGGYYYGESSLKYLSDNKFLVVILKSFTIFLIIASSVIPSDFLWRLIDFFVAILALINIYALIKLRNEIK